MPRPRETECPAARVQMEIWVKLGGRKSGIVGDRNHTYGFHRGAAYVPASDYSRTRDPNGSDGPYPDWGWCCAGDYWHGGKATLRARHAALLTRLIDGDPALSTVCEFIGQPWPNRPVYYWARWNGSRTLQRYTGAGHDLWSHISTYRSRSGTPPPLWVPAGMPAKKPAKAPEPVRRSPAWPRNITYFKASSKPKYHVAVRQWQARMKQRGWKITADGYYGPRSAEVCRAFQREKRLVVDGLLGPITWRSAWWLPVT